MQGERGTAAPRAALQRPGSADGMGRDSLYRFRATVVAALLAAAALGATSAPAGDFFAAYEAYERGDREAACEGWKRLAQAGDVDAQFNLGACYENGLVGPADAGEAARWYRAAAERRLDLAQLALARLQRADALDPDSEAGRIELLEIAARRGLAEAQYELGVAYDRGLGVTQDHATALRWYEEAAEQGIAEAQYNLATLHDKGQGTPHDPVKAHALYEDAAKAGQPRAMNNLGYMYERGLHGVTDYGMAVVWYHRAARKGLAIAQSNLATLHYLGLGVTRDFEEARRWYEAAAEQGDAAGQNGLGLLYANGLGVERDPVRAKAWFDLAAAGAGPESERAERYRARLERLMSSAERGKAAELGARIAARLDAREAAGAASAAFGRPRPAHRFGDTAIYAQRLLKSLGYYEAAVDGLAGPLTVAAAGRFVRDNGLNLAPRITQELVTALEEARAARVAAAAAAEVARADGSRS